LSLECLDILKGLTPEQRVAVLHLAGPAMVMSCAGSGKTSTITKRIAYLIKHGVSPTNIVGVTFTNKAAGEMKERVQRLVGGAGRHVWLSTFHSFCATLLRANFKQYGVPRNFTIADEGDANELTKIAIATVARQMRRNPEENEENVRYVRSWISGHKDYVRTPDDLNESNTRFPEYIPYYREYQRRLVHDGMLDFDDLIMKTVLGLRRNESLQKFYNHNIHHMLVDEWQDTNFSQFELVRLLTQQRGNVFIVGDTDQCLPAGTPITTNNGTRPIETIRKKDWVLGGSGYGYTAYGKVAAVAKRKYVGDLIEIITESNRVVRGTPEHCIFGKLPTNADDKFYVYLMYKEDVGCRIGWCKSYRSQGNGKSAFGPIVRMRQEHADRTWILRVCNDKNEAAEWEATLATRYGIPLVCFYSSGRNINITQEGIDHLFANIDTKYRASKCLEQLGLSFEYPHYTASGGSTAHRTTAHFSMFAQGRKCKGEYGTVVHGHTLSLHSSSKNLWVSAGKRLGGHVTNRNPRFRWKIQKSLKDYDKLYEEVRHVAENVNANIMRTAKFTEDKTYDFMPIGNAFPGITVPVVQLDSKVRDEKIISVKRVHYDGYVYDLSIPELRNYCANNVLVHNSIYGWRGADILNTERFYKVFPETKTYTLQTNFRSVPGIAAVANALIAHNTNRPDKTIVTHKQKGETPKSYGLKTTEDETRFVINTIRDMVKLGKDDWRDFAIIYRIRSLSRAIEDEAVGRNIPYRVVGSLSFYNRAAIKDILAYARLLVNPQEDTSFTRIVNKPTRGIGAVSFAAFNRAAEVEDTRLFVALGKRLYDKCGMLASAADGFRRLRDVFAQWRRMDQRKAGPIIEAILKNSGYLGYAENIRDEKYRDRVIEDLYELVNAANQFDDTKDKKKRHKGLRGFLEHTQLMQQDEKDKDPNSVTLLTAHAAKGLEFKNVFVIGCVEGATPLYPRGEPGQTMTSDDIRQHYEEERRIFFVAVTRAQERLWLTWPRARRSRDGSLSMSSPSRFLEESLVHDIQVKKEKKQKRYDDENAIDAGDGIRIYGITRQPKTEVKRKDGGANAVIRNRTQNLSEGQSQEDLRAARREHLRRLATRGIATTRPTKSNH
jgi:DNA helicase-2/ATP-dependent DNA helicase PcrA